MHIIRTRCKIGPNDLKYIFKKNKYRLLTVGEYDSNTCNKSSYISIGTNQDGSESITLIGENENSSRTYLTYTDDYLDSLDRAKKSIRSIDDKKVSSSIFEFFNKYVYGR